MQGQWAVTVMGSRGERGALLAKALPLPSFFFILGAETGIFIIDRLMDCRHLTRRD